MMVCTSPDFFFKDKIRKVSEVAPSETNSRLQFLRLLKIQSYPLLEYKYSVGEKGKQTLLTTVKKNSSETPIHIL